MDTHGIEVERRGGSKLMSENKATKSLWCPLHRVDFTLKSRRRGRTVKESALQLLLNFFFFLAVLDATQSLEHRRQVLYH